MNKRFSCTGCTGYWIFKNQIMAFRWFWSSWQKWSAKKGAFNFSHCICSIKILKYSGQRPKIINFTRWDYPDNTATQQNCDTGHPLLLKVPGPSSKIIFNKCQKLFERWQLFHWAIQKFCTSNPNRWTLHPTFKSFDTFLEPPQVKATIWLIKGTPAFSFYF